MKTKQTGNFGKLVEAYNAVRPSYPSKVMQHIYSEMSHSNPIVLDLGCGTGISTRQLAKKKGFVVGCDIDEEMIHAAISHKTPNTAYTIGSASKLPFPDATFDVVTMFTAFHWFTSKKSLSEIRRVSKKNATMFIVQPRHVSTFSADLRKILSEFLGTKLAPKYSKKSFEEVLDANNFSYSVKKIVTTDKYTIEQYLLLVQSYSVWNEVPDEKKKEALRILEKHYRGFLKDGKIHDKREITIITAKP